MFGGNFSFCSLCQSSSNNFNLECQDFKIEQEPEQKVGVHVVLQEFAVVCISEPELLGFKEFNSTNSTSETSDEVDVFKKEIQEYFLKKIGSIIQNIGDVNLRPSMLDKNSK